MPENGSEETCAPLLDRPRGIALVAWRPAPREAPDAVTAWSKADGA